MSKIRSTEQLSRLLGDIYAANEADNHLETLMHLLIDITDARTSSIRTENNTTDEIIDSVSFGFTDEITRAYTEHYYKEDVWVAHTEPLPKGQFYTCNDPTIDKKLVNTAFYNDMCKPSGVRYVLSAYITDSDGMRQRINFHREPSRGAFTKDDIALTNLLAPHIKQSLHLATRLQQLDINHQGFKLSSEQNHKAILLLDKKNHFVDGNTHTDDLMRSGLFKITNGRVTLGLRDSTQAFENACLQAKLSISKLMQIHETGSFSFAITHQNTYYLLRIEPWIYETGFVGAKEVGLCISVKAEKPVELDTIAISDQLGLTLTEAEIAKLTCEGNTAREISEIRQCKPSTVNFHLNAIYQKLNIHSSTQLANILMSSLSIK